MVPKNSRQRALNLILQCVGSVDNENLTVAQRELLLWHWKLRIGMQQIQAMMHDQLFEDHLGRNQDVTPAARGLEELFFAVLERFVEPIHALHVYCKN
jgi:hypothetical protein